MNRRKNPLVTGKVYHICSRSIAGFKIFNTEAEFLRMIATIRYYQREKPSVKFSKFIRSARARDNNFDETSDLSGKEKLVKIIAYCLMPTHLHLVLKQLKENGISTFMSNVLNSYTRYFNIKHSRKGPLWEGRFRSVLVEADEQLLHLTRYIHLNPVTAYLVGNPEQWSASSYQEYLAEINDDERICEYDGILDIKPGSHKRFVEDMVSYQRELAKVKKILLEEPTPS